jgi:hypothetical protein
MPVKAFIVLWLLVVCVELMPGARRADAQDLGRCQV